MLMRFSAIYLIFIQTCCIRISPIWKKKRAHLVNNCSLKIQEQVYKGGEGVMLGAN